MLVVFYRKTGKQSPCIHPFIFVQMYLDLYSTQTKAGPRVSLHTHTHRRLSTLVSNLPKHFWQYRRRGRRKARIAKIYLHFWYPPGSVGRRSACKILGIKRLPRSEVQSTKNILPNATITTLQIKKNEGYNLLGGWGNILPPTLAPHY